jgi:hypothetical protein
VEGSDVSTVDGTVDGYAVARAMGRAGPDGWRVGHRRVTGSEGWLLREEGGLVDEEAGVAVVALAATTPAALVRRYESGRTVRVDLARTRTAGVDVATGRVLWRHGGADFGCLELARQDLPVRCALEGDRLVRKSWDESRLAGARAFLEGYDVETGETTWRHELDRRATRILALRLNEMDIAIDRIADADELVVVPTRDGARLVSLVDGSSRPVAVDGEEDTVLCTREIDWRHRFDTSGASGVVGFGDERTRFVRTPCDSRGKARPGGSPGVAGIVTGGVDAGDGIWSWATGDSIEGYRLVGGAPD